MGADHSNIVQSATGSHLKEATLLVMPVYYTDETTTATDHTIAKEKWLMISEDRSAHFKTIQASTGYESCIVYFYDSFYNRLFDVHPSCVHLFKSGLQTQGKKLAKLITLVLHVYDAPEKCNDILSKLTVGHNARGIRAVEYGIIGEVLFWSLKLCLGDAYDAAAHKAWVRLFSSILRIMVPLVVEYEMEQLKNVLVTNEGNRKRSSSIGAEGKGSDKSNEPEPKRTNVKLAAVAPINK